MFLYTTLSGFYFICITIIRVAKQGQIVFNHHFMIQMCEVIKNISQNQKTPVPRMMLYFNVEK